MEFGAFSGLIILSQTITSTQQIFHLRAFRACAKNPLDFSAS